MQVFNKRGDIGTEEVVKIILAIIVLVIIIILCVALAKMINGNLRYEQAKNTFDSLNYEIEKLQDGQTKTFLVEGPPEWFLYKSNDNFCYLPFSCLDGLKKEDLLTEDQIKQGMDNVIPTCKIYGICKNSPNVSIPYDAFDFKTGLVINYAAYYLTFGQGSRLVVGTINNAILIGKNTIPQSIQIRKVNDRVDLINLQSTTEANLMQDLLSLVKRLDPGKTERMNFNGIDGEYLLAFSGGKVSSSGNIICLCKTGSLSKCDSEGACIVSDVLMRGGVEIRGKEFSVAVAREDATSFNVSA